MKKSNKKAVAVIISIITLCIAVVPIFVMAESQFGNYEKFYSFNKVILQRHVHSRKVMRLPIFRQATGLEVNDGDARNPNGRFFGREISIVEPDVLPDFDTASAGDVIDIFWQPQEYAINENFAWTLFRCFDHETNEWVDKGICIVDGKVLNPAGFVLIKKA